MNLVLDVWISLAWRKTFRNGLFEEFPYLELCCYNCLYVVFLQFRRKLTYFTGEEWLLTNALPNFNFYYGSVSEHCSFLVCVRASYSYSLLMEIRP